MITAVFILSPSTSMSLAASQTSFEIGNGVDKADALIVGIEMPAGEQLAGRGAVCEPNSGRSPAFCAGNRPPVLARGIFVSRTDDIERPKPRAGRISDDDMED